ncbi:MAG: ATP-grasp domain-containing protein [Bdellovibrionales bacterium]|nr:ATP-grasp domain-containing protein [Bdellovibrionales bacterium]
MSDFTKVAIANRGEVAVRIIRACQELGLQTVLLHSKADVGSRAYRLSDHCICIGDSPVGESYLSIERNIDGILASGAEAVHPGFGFLSENADFARVLEQKGITFIGPSADVIEKMGDKIAAKKIIEKAGLPTVPGYNGDDQSIDHLIKEAEKIGYPVIAKAAAGGGGRGMKVIENKSQAREMIEAAKREGQAAFGSDKIFLEKYLNRAKHIEVQIFGDLAGQVVHLFERECSIQRRHQKIIEEALSPSLDHKLRNQLTHAAVTLAKEVGYVGAGTVEFLVQDGQFYFLEMNTRLQVEHPVTELVLGVDLVKAQVLTMMNRFAVWDQDILVPRGHAIECRIYAEDPYTAGIPSTGILGHQYWPQGPGRRFEVAFDEGDEVTPYYDSMIAKAIVWDETRSRAIMKMQRVLSEIVLFGVKTNIPLLQQMLAHPEFIDGSFNTQFVNSYFAEGAIQRDRENWKEQLAQIAYQKVSEAPHSNSSSTLSPWSQDWRNV